MNYERTVSEYKELRSLIQKMIKRNTTRIYQNEYDYVNMEYGKIVKKYTIQKGNDATLDEVWNVYTIQKYLDPNLNKKVKK